MAHFAELESKTDPTGFTSDTHLIVKRVIVVGNDVETSDGPLGENDMHVDGETWCQNFFGSGTWKQTSYNNNFRKQYAGKGFRYDESKDKFIAPQPYASWSLNSNEDWQAPVANPTVITYGDNTPYNSIDWDEPNLRWVAYDDQNNQFVWNPESSSWIATGN
jgi:hypothetical protein